MKKNSFSISGLFCFLLSGLISCSPLTSSSSETSSSFDDATSESSSSEEDECIVDPGEMPGGIIEKDVYEELKKDYERNTFSTYLRNAEDGSFIKIENNANITATNFTNYEICAFLPEYGEVNNNPEKDFALIYDENDCFITSPSRVNKEKDVINCKTYYFLFIGTVFYVNSKEEYVIDVVIKYKTYTLDFSLNFVDLSKPYHIKPLRENITEEFSVFNNMLTSLQLHIPTLPISKYYFDQQYYINEINYGNETIYLNYKDEYNLEYLNIVHDSVYLPTNFTRLDKMGDDSLPGTLNLSIKSDFLEQLYDSDLKLNKTEKIESFLLISRKDIYTYHTTPANFIHMSYRFEIANKQFYREYIKEYPSHFLNVEINDLNVFFKLDEGFDLTIRKQTNKITAFFEQNGYFYTSMCIVII